MKKSNGLTTVISKNAIEIPDCYFAIPLDELKDELFGETGTHERDIYEAEFKEELLDDVVRQANHPKTNASVIAFLNDSVDPK